VRAVLECVLCFAVDPLVVTQIFEAVCDLVARVPVQTLTFRRDAGIWDRLE